MSATERCKALFVLRVGKGLRESMNGRLVKRRLGSGVSEDGVSPLLYHMQPVLPPSLLPQSSVKSRTFSFMLWKI